MPYSPVQEGGGKFSLIRGFSQPPDPSACRAPRQLPGGQSTFSHFYPSLLPQPFTSIRAGAEPREGSNILGLLCLTGLIPPVDVAAVYKHHFPLAEQQQDKVLLSLCHRNTNSRSPYTSKAGGSCQQIILRCVSFCFKWTHPATCKAHLVSSAPTLCISFRYPAR